MSLPEIVSREEWRAARVELLAEEKAMTRARESSTPAAPAADGRDHKAYVFEGPEGRVAARSLRGSWQLIVQHFMFDPSWEDGCPSCTAGTTSCRPGCSSTCGPETPRSPSCRALRSPRSSATRPGGVGLPLVLVERQRLQPRLPRHRRRAVAPVEYNFRVKGTELGAHGVSRAVSSSSRATASSCATGTESSTRIRVRPRHGVAGGSYYFLDLTALGRQEEWEEPRAVPSPPTVRTRTSRKGLLSPRRSPARRAQTAAMIQQRRGDPQGVAAALTRAGAAPALRSPRRRAARATTGSGRPRRRSSADVEQLFGAA